MLLTLSTTHSPATDLGYLLAKHPGRQHSFELSSGIARVFYPEASDGRNHQPLRRVHERAFGVLALESEPVDPRL
jgi:hypothetical protein